MGRREAVYEGKDTLRWRGINSQDGAGGPTWEHGLPGVEETGADSEQEKKVRGKLTWKREAAHEKEGVEEKAKNGGDKVINSEKQGTKRDENI